MRKKIKFFLGIASVLAVISICVYVEAGKMEVFRLWGAMIITFFVYYIIYASLKILDKKCDEEQEQK